MAVTSRHVGHTAVMHERITAGSFTDRLDTWSSWATATVLTTGMLALVTADRAFPAVGMGPMYIPLIALAGWRLGLRASCLVAAVASLLNIFPHHVHELGLDPTVAAARGVMRFGVYAFIVALVHALRRAYDRECVRASRDGLTGALNRATFERQAKAMLSGHKAAGSALALALIDVDDFKRINDAHGHGAGDHVLRALTAAATSALDGRSILARLGGDEFAVLMPIASITEGEGAVERLHRDLSAVLAWSVHPITVSTGAVLFHPSSSFDWAALMHEADQHMYAVKTSGKARVRVATVLRSAGASASNPAPVHLRPIVST